MTGQQIKDLPISTNVVDNDLIHVQEGGLVDKQVTRQNLFKDLILPWSNTRAYLQNEIVASNGKLWQAVIANTGNIPETDNGTNWVIAVVLDIAKIQEPINTVIPQVGGGTLISLRENELRDGSTYSLPLANSVLVNQTITISLPDEFSAFTPTVQISGTDIITDSTGSNTNILFDSGSVTITLTSDGVSKWIL